MLTEGMNMSIRYLCGFLLLALPLSAQEAAVAVGSDGVMRWSGSGQEVALFGVTEVFMAWRRY